jgi:DNA-directed RNA polymerase II subunit RPB2
MGGTGQTSGRLCHIDRMLLQKCVDKGKEINLTAAVSKDTITRGLRYAVATGNWGQQGTADLRAGVSQVLHNY